MSMTATEIHTFTGGVDELTEPTGNGPWKVGLGVDSGQYRNVKKFVAWPTDYKTKEPNQFLTVLQAAHASGDVVSVAYYTQQKTGPKGTYPQNTITDVTVVGAAPVNPSQPPTESGWAAPQPTSSPVSAPQGAAPSTNFDAVEFLAKGLEQAAADIKGYAADVRALLAKSRDGSF